MTDVKPKDGESVEAMLKRFKRKVDNAGIIQEVKARQEFVPRSKKRRLAKAAAQARIAKYRKKMEEQIAFENSTKFPPKKRFKKEDENNNQDRRPRRDHNNSRPQRSDSRPRSEAKPRQPKAKPLNPDALKNLQDKFNS